MAESVMATFTPTADSLSVGVSRRYAHIRHHAWPEEPPMCAATGGQMSFRYEH